MNMKTLTILLASTLVISGCTHDKYSYDASGTFEAIETVVSAEATGVIKKLDITEGQTVARNTLIGFIDSVQLHLKKKQTEAQIKAVLSRQPDSGKQLAALLEELQHAEREQQRVSRLVASDAATQKQYDDATAQVNILKRRIAALESSLGVTTKSLSEETLPLRVQVEQLQDQIERCRIVNAVSGTVLTKYVEEHEMVVMGSPLYRIADVSTLILRAYITGDQLAAIKLGQEVTVFVDTADGEYKAYSGKVTWISNKAEFTPKTIQTKDERANLVYAVKIAVKNDGFLKIGMYGEVKI